ncbi:iron uptake porin [Prochlorococcus marinus]|uniref:iron uptake porin n=1 Tax=Prochlorococcus marinus TaxID=1219 RepID=UPI0022B3AC35|nr:iron uptake porin [Prochlorococcus marinus]
MKLFQQLLVAPAALGLVAPLAANAVEVNINDVANYANPEEQLVETTAQFSDVVPGDWAYTALQNLSESYGCVDNAYSQSLKSGQALTRFEAAALVNACLDGGLMASGHGLTSEASRLTNEFGSEMAILKGRVDGLEYKLNEYNAGQFSSTTLMSGDAVFSLGAVDGSTAGEKLHSVYAYGLNLTTSYTGKDSLDARIIAGNSGTEPLASLDSAESTTNQALTIDELSYTFPVGDFTVTAGPVMKQDGVISATLSTYSDAFYISNQPYSTGGTETGAGVGATYYFANDWNASLSFVGADSSDADNGIGTREGDDVITASLGYDGDTWGGGLLVSEGDKNGSDADYDSWGYGVYWSPEGNYPTFSFGFDTKDNEGTADEEAWTIAVDYAGFGPGTLSAAYQSVDDETNQLAKYEVYYNWEIADGIAIQPGLFTNEVANADDEIGVAVETFFKF